nr:reverse transcriptase domain-containing protein [Tanacetum cinerariifolium]
MCEAKSDKSSINEPPEVQLKDLPPHLEYAFLEGDDKLPIIIVKDLSIEENTALITVLKSHNPVHCVPKKGGFTVVENEENKLILTRLVTGWRVCIDYRKLNEATHKDHFPLPFMDQMLERLAGNQYYCFLDGFSGYFQIPIDPQYQKKTTFTCPYGTFAYRRMPFGLYNAPGTFQRKPWTFLRLATMDPPGDIMAQTAQPIRKVQLNELRDQAYENSLIYKEKTKRLHDSKIKDRVFNIDNRVLLFNSRLKIFSGKLKFRWSGLFTISHVFPYGTFELSQPDSAIFQSQWS